MDEATIEHLAGLLAGLQAPRSINGYALGAALPHYDALRDHYRLLGWQTPEEIRDAIRREEAAK